MPGDGPPPLEGYAVTDFAAETIRHWVYRRGEGPPVILLHELPGLSPAAIDVTAAKLVDAGFTVHLPLLFGRPRDDSALRHLPRVCISRELAVFQARGTAPIVGWLRALCRELHARAGGPGVGVIGMCLTGNFAIALVAEPAVIASVTCQPSLPFIGTSTRAADLALGDADLEAAKARAATLPKPALVGFRFEGDRICPAARFERLRREFGAAFKGEDLPGDGHSTIAKDLVDRAGHPTKAALRKIVAFLGSRLRGPGTAHATAAK